MTPEQHRELLAEITELRRESVRTRRWVVFTGVCLAVLVFVPEVAAWIQTMIAAFLKFVGPSEVAGVVIVSVVAAIVIANFGYRSAGRTLPDDKG